MLNVAFLIQRRKDVFVRVKDVDGIDVVCPFDESLDSRPVNDANWNDCIETGVIGRYAGRLKIVDPVV